MSYISLIRLNNFRNLANQEIDLSKLANIFIGPNGSGKTNIIESISLLVPGRGIKKQLLHKITTFKIDKPWVIFVKLKQNNNTQIDIAATYERTKSGSSLKKILINGNKYKKLTELNYTPPVLWFIPEMERLFTASPSVRRGFIDRITYSFDQTILFKTNTYNKLLKERYNIIQAYNFDSIWLDKIEEKIADLGIEIIKKRDMSIKMINKMFNIVSSKITINKCSVRLIGYIDEIILKNTTKISKKKYIIKLKNSRNEDRIKGGCKIGPNKSDIEITYLKNNTEASFCSTGQQKEIILNILLCQAYCLINIFKKKPIILLDEICSHLDNNIRSTLLHLIEQLKIQVLMTGTDKKLFSFLSKKARFFKVNNGIIS